MLTIWLTFSSGNLKGNAYILCEWSLLASLLVIEEDCRKTKGLIAVNGLTFREMKRDLLITLNIF
jgi:hypothetical protein